MKKLSIRQRNELARRYNWAECVYDKKGNLVHRLAGDKGETGWQPVSVMQISEVSDLIMSVRISQHLYNRLSIAAEANQRTCAATVRLALIEYLDRRKK